MSYEREISKHIVLLCPGFCLNYIGKHYRNKNGHCTEPRRTSICSTPVPQDFRRLLLALVGMPSASEAYIHLSSLPRRDQKSLLIKEISNKNYMPDSHMFTQVSPHFFSDKQDMARHRDSSAYCNSLQQKLWGLKTPSVPCAQFSAADCLRAQGVKRESPGPWEASHFQVLHQNSEDCFPTG